jgi:EpsI family protein
MPIKHTITACAVMIFAAAVLDLFHSSESIYPNRSFADFPIEIDEWKGVKEHFDDKIQAALGVDDYHLATYSAPDGKKVQLYIGFYQSQREGDIIHSPKNCMPGAGWKITESSVEELNVSAPKNNTVKVLRLKIKNGIKEQMVLYWYHSRGRVVHSEYLQKIFLLFDSIMRKRTDGAFVRLVAPIINGKEEQATQTLKEFSIKVFPNLREYIPD